MKYFVILLILIGFVSSAFAMHEPTQLYPHSIVLPPDIKDKTFAEFMDWCTPYYGEKCSDLYEQNHISNVLSPLKQFKSGIQIDKITCKENLQLIIKNNGNPACVKPETKIKLVERGWINSKN
jgi:hypothetical protein